MVNLIEQLIKKETEELALIIKRFDKKTTIPLAIFILKLDRFTYNKYLQLLSAVKQIGYMISLCLTSKGTDIISSEDFHDITDRLQKIENLYKQLQTGTGKLNYYDENYRQEAVASCSYGSFFFNADLIYYEQLIDKIEKTFIPMERVIQEKLQLTIADFIL